jgi:WD40 repeat protein
MSGSSDSQLIVCQSCQAKLRVPKSALGPGLSRPCPRCQTLISLDPGNLNASSTPPPPATSQTPPVAPVPSPVAPVPQPPLPPLPPVPSRSFRQILASPKVLIGMAVLLLTAAIGIASLFLWQSKPSRDVEELGHNEPPEARPEGGHVEGQKKPGVRRNRGPLPKDVQTLAELVSIDYVEGLQLESLTAELVSQKLEQRAELKRIADKNTGEITTVARGALNAIAHLERIYTTLVPNDLEAIPLAILSNIFVQARMERDLSNYVEQSQALAPNLISWFESHGDETLARGDIKCTFQGDRVKLTNNSDQDLSQSLVQLDFDQIWGDKSSATMFIPNWKQGTSATIPGQRAAAATATALKIRIIGWNARSDSIQFTLTERIHDACESVYDQALSQLNKKSLNAAKQSAERLNALLKKYPDSGLQRRLEKLLGELDQAYAANARNAVRSGDFFIGTWTFQARDRQTPYTGPLGIYVHKSHDAQGSGPIEGLLFDPITCRAVKSFSGTYDRMQADVRVTSRLKSGLEMPVSRRPATSNALRQGDHRDFGFSVTESGLVGNDSVGDRFTLNRVALSSEQIQRLRRAVSKSEGDESLEIPASIKGATIETPIPVTTTGVLPTFKRPAARFHLQASPGKVGDMPGADDGNPAALWFSNDGKYVCYSSRGSQGIVFVWDASNGKRVSARPMFPAENAPRVNVALSPVGTRLAFMLNDRLTFIDMASGKGTREAKLGAGGCLAWSPTGKSLVVGDATTGRVCVVEPSGKVTNSIEFRKPVQAVSFNQSETSITVAMGTESRAWGQIDGVDLGELTEHEFPVMRLGYHSENDQILSLDGEDLTQRDIGVWNHVTGKQIARRQVGFCVKAHDVSRDWRRLICIETDGALVSYDLATGEEEAFFSKAVAASAPTLVALSPCGSLAAVLNTPDRRIALWKLPPMAVSGIADEPEPKK